MLWLLVLRDRTRLADVTQNWVGVRLGMMANCSPTQLPCGDINPVGLVLPASADMRPLGTWRRPRGHCAKDVRPTVRDAFYAGTPSTQQYRPKLLRPSELTVQFFDSLCCVFNVNRQTTTGRAQANSDISWESGILQLVCLRKGRCSS